MIWPFNKKKDTFAPTVSAVEVGKVATVQQSSGPYRVDANIAVSRDNRGYHLQNLADYRYSLNADDMLKLLSKIDPDVSAGIWNFLRLANSGLNCTVYNAKGTRDAKLQAQFGQMVTRLSGLQDFKNWTIRTTLEDTANQLLKYVLLRGACASEAVLGKDRRLQKIAVIDPITVSFKQPTLGLWLPYQTDTNGKDIPLNIPTFFWSVLDPDAQSPYETPPFLPVIQAVLFNMAVMQDLEKIVKRVAYPRIAIKIIEQTLRKFAPAAVQSDDAKMQAWLNTQRASIATALKDLKPEDAAVFFDSMDIDVLETKGNTTVDYRPLKEVIDQRIISGLKSLPTILGRQFGSSQTLSGVEALLYARSIKGVQKIAASQLTQLLTLAMQLEGLKGTVQVTYGPVNLKPENELEAFRVLKQSRVLELLSLGFIADEEAAEELTGDTTLPKTFKPLSGTGFYTKKSTVDASAVNATRNPTASEQAGGGRNK